MITKVSGLTIASALVIILFPIGGLLIVLFFFFTKNLINEKDFYLDIDNVEEKANFTFLSDIDIQKESDIIALEDSLEVGDICYRRKTVLDILKRDDDNYSDFLYKAIKNEDSETTHYAATSILETKRKLDFKLREAEKEYMANPTNDGIILEYINLLTKKLKDPYLDERIRYSYYIEKIKILKEIVEKKISKEEKYIISLIESLLEVEEYLETQYFCNFYMENYPYTEKKYLTLLRSFYVMEDNINFKDLLLRLKNDNLTLTKEGISIVDFWLGGKS